MDPITNHTMGEVHIHRLFEFNPYYGWYRRVDPVTGDMVSVTYSSGPPPHARHDVFAPDGLCVCVCARARARVRACVRACVHVCLCACV